MQGPDLTDAQQEALIWLSERNGEGNILKDGTLLAAGEIAPHVRATFTALRDLGLMEIQSKNRRIKITSAGSQFVAGWNYES